VIDVVGYARLSTLKHDPTLRFDARAAAGCAKIFDHHASTGHIDRLETRSVRPPSGSLIESIAAFEHRGVGFHSIIRALDTATPGGRSIPHLFGALGKFKGNLNGKRTRSGPTAIAAQDRKGGSKWVVDAEKLARA
jgi:DNA invertase Pin-like site-specific DNA recombinase